MPDKKHGGGAKGKKASGLGRAIIRQQFSSAPAAAELETERAPRATEPAPVRAGTHRAPARPQAESTSFAR